MWFDLTKDVRLPEKKYRLYKKLQTLLYAASFLIAVAMAFIVIFDPQNFYFSFLNPNSGQNTINPPQNQHIESLSETGEAKIENKIYFNAAPLGIFSRAVIELSSVDDAGIAGSITARRGHQAFLYPEGSPIGFKDGTLLKNKNDFFLVSNEVIRKFAGAEIVSRLDYNFEAFIEARDEEMQYNPSGRIISANEGYPDDSLFKIKDDFYVLQDSHLKKFTSEQAFLSQYKTVQAIEKNEDFFAKYSVSDEPMGYGDGSLVSYGESIYITSNGQIFPINNPETFLEKGYVWEDVIAASTDEIALYEKAPLFTIRRSHPDGTIFKTAESGKYYLVSNFEKHLLPSENIAKSWINTPITAFEKSLDTTTSCAIEKDLFGSYSCALEIDKLQDMNSANYEFIMAMDKEPRLEALEISFRKNINRKNLSVFLNDIFNKIKFKYVSKNIPGL